MNLNCNYSTKEWRGLQKKTSPKWGRERIRFSSSYNGSNVVLIAYSEGETTLFLLDYLWIIWDYTRLNYVNNLSILMLMEMLLT